MATKKAITTAEIIRTRDDALPFVVTARTKRGRWVGEDEFDPEIRDGSLGEIEGIEALLVLLAQLKKSEGEVGSFQVRGVLRAAGRKASLGNGPAEWAAFSFLGAVAPLLEFAAKHADWQPFLAGEIARARSNQQHEEDWRARAKEQFVSRMRAGKAARALSSGAPTVHSVGPAKRPHQVRDARPSAQ